MSLPPLSGGREAPCLMQLVADLDEGAIAREAIDVAEAATRRGWRAVVASAGGPLERDLARVGGAHATLPAARGGVLDALRSRLATRRVVRRWRPEVIHARAAAVASPVNETASRAGASLVVTASSLVAELPTLRAADRIIAGSEFAAEGLLGTPGVDPTRVTLVRRWLDPARFDPGQIRGHRVAELAERFGIAAGPKVIVVFDHVARRGGCATLVDALRRGVLDDAVALFLGEPPKNGDEGGGDGRSLLAAAREAGIAERCRFGRTSDLPAALTLADLVVEACDRALPEHRHLAAAQAMGRPVVAVDAGAAGEALMPAATGWLVAAGDAAELARAIALALAMPEASRERLAARARAFALQRFGAPGQIERELAVYDELLRARLTTAPTDARRQGGLASMA